MGIVGLSIAATLVAFGVVFIFCEFGERISVLSEEINDTICELDWYSFPLHMQRMMPMILLSTQRPITLTAYGGIGCNRTTFKKVWRLNGYKIHFLFFKYS